MILLNVARLQFPRTVIPANTAPPWMSGQARHDDGKIFVLEVRQCVLCDHLQ